MTIPAECWRQYRWSALSIDTIACRDTLIRNWICRFGVPAHITSDQGAQFTSTLWSRTCEVIGAHHNTTTAYHPKSNGLEEQPHRRLKEALKVHLATTDWPEHLPWVLLAVNIAPREDSRKSAAEMVYGTSLTLPAQLAAGNKLPVEEILHNLHTAEPIPTRHGRTEGPSEPPAHPAGADLVYVSRGGQLPPLAQPYDGPYRVLERDPKFFHLDIGGRQTAVSMDRLKPHTSTADATSAATLRRGWPPRAVATSSLPSTPEFSTPTARSPSPGLPATTSTRPTRLAGHQLD